MDNILDRVETVKSNALITLRKWDKEKDAKEVMREYLSEEGMIFPDKTKLDELLTTIPSCPFWTNEDKFKVKGV